MKICTITPVGYEHYIQNIYKSKHSPCQHLLKEVHNILLFLSVIANLLCKFHQVIITETHMVDVIIINLFVSSHDKNPSPYSTAVSSETRGGMCTTVSSVSSSHLMWVVVVVEAAATMSMSNKTSYVGSRSSAVYHCTMFVADVSIKSCKRASAATLSLPSKPSNSSSSSAASGGPESLHPAPVDRRRGDRFPRAPHKLECIL